MPVNTPRADYAAVLPQWQRCRDCHEGTDAVKARGQTYLPPLDSHTKPGGSPKYDAYRKRALFYNATGRTVQGLVGAIFQKPPVFTCPGPVEDHIKDITQTGVSGEMFAMEVTEEVITVGRKGILIDMAPDAAPPGRPYWVEYCAEDIVSWRTERRGGDEVVTMVVLRENVEEVDPKDAFEQKCHEQYRVLALDEAGRYTQTVYRKVEASGKWEPYAEPGKDVTIVPLRRGAPLPLIPFVFIGPTSVSPNIAKPPLLDLVDVNLSHYRTMADLEHGRHFVALPTPWVSGVVGGNQDGPLEIGSGAAWVLEKDGRAGMLEFSGQGLGALEKADEQKRKLMATLGARLLEEQSGTAETATAVGMRHSGEHATLRTVAQSVGQGLTMALQIHVWWMGTEERPSDVKADVALNVEFFTVRATPDEVRALMLEWQAGAISYKTFYERLQKGGWTRDGIDAEEERAEIEREEALKPEPPEPPEPPDPNAPPKPPDPNAPPAPPVPPKPPEAE